MKLKRFVAVVISLAMVLSIVPAFSLTASADLGDVVTVDGTTYVVVGENLVPDGGFEDANGNFSWGSWFSPNGSNGPFANKCEDWFYKVNRNTNEAVLYKSGSITATDYALGTRWNDKSTGLCSLSNNIAVESGKTYHVAFDYKHKSNNVDMGYIVTTFVTTATASTDGSTVVVPKPAAATTSWQTAEAIFTAPSDGYVFFHFRWLGGDGNPGNGPYFYFDNFKVEEVNTATATNVTVNYVDENGTSIDSKTLSTYVNAKLSMKDENVAPHVIEKDGVLYARDITNTDVFVTANATVKVTYTAADEVEASKTTGLGWFAAEWTMGGSDFGYADIQVKDQSGTAFTDFVYAGETNGIYPADRGGTGANRADKTRIRGTHWTSGTTKMRIVVQNNENSTYDVKMVLFDAVNVASPLIIADFVYTGSVNGIADVASWAQTGGGAAPAYNNVKYYTLLPEDTTEYTITVNYGTTGTTETYKGLKGVTVTAPAKSITVNDVLYIFESYAHTIDGDATITLDPVTTLNVADGLIAHYTLEGDVTDSANNFDGSVIGSADVTFNANGYVTLPGGTGQGAMTIPSELAKYLTEDFTISMWVKQDTSYASDGKAVAFWDISNGNYDRFFWQQKGTATTIQHRGDPRAYTDYTGVDAMKGNWALVTTTFDASEGTLTAYVNGETISGTTTGTWSASHSLANLVNRGDTNFYLGHNHWNNGDNPEMKGDMAQVRIYNKALTAEEVNELLSDKKTITVKYVDENGATITDSTAVEYFSSSATFDVPTAVTSSTGAAYELTSLSYDENATSVSVTATGTEYTAIYTSVEAIPNGVEAIPAVTVVEGNEPVLPSVVTVTTNKTGITYEANVTWNTSSLTVGANTVTGTVEGYEVTATVSVTVLPVKFEVPEFTATGSTNTNAFPGEVTGDFAFEFDYTSAQNGDDWIYISQKEGEDGRWSKGNLAIGVGNNKLKAPTSLGGSLAEQMTTSFEAGKTYRILAQGNTLSNSYSLTVTAEDGTVLNDGSETYYFRTNDTTNGIPLNYINVRGNFTLSNIKVYAPSVALTEYTVVVTGSVSETTKVMAKSAEIVPIPHYDGHIMKTRTISGTTITATYEATTTSIGSWYMRNNFTDDNWITQSKYIGSHNAFADDDSAFVNEGGALYGDTGASTTGTTAVSNSQTQSVRVLDQLNAGVRYFDVRLSRQKDGTFATVHGPAFENFRDVAITMAQWAKENPGEVIILDFQTVRDALYGGSATGHYEVITDNDSYYGPDEGDDNQYVYDALVQLFKDTGLTDYMTTDWDRKYGALTNSGTKTAILPFGKGRAVNCQGGYFVNRAALNNGVTYTEESSYSDVVSYLDSTYANLTGGPTISTVHAYTTPFSLFGSGDLIADAQDNNPNWINEEGFYNWMSYDKGDVFMMNDSVSDIDLYYEALNKFNRTGSSYSYTENFIRTDDNVTINGAQANVPFSTKWTVEPTATSATYTIDGVEYTAHTAYELDLMQFDRDSVQPTGEVTVTFPKISTDTTTVDALLSADGTQVYWTAEIGEAVAIPTTALADVILATRTAPGKEYTVNYVADGTTIYTKTELVPYGQVVYSVPAGDFYLEATDKAYILNSVAAMSHTAAAEDTITTFSINVTIVSDNAVLRDTFANVNGSNDCNNTSNMLFIGAADAEISNIPDEDADGASTTTRGDDGVVTNPRIPLITFNVPEVGEGKAVKLNIYVANANHNLNAGGSMKLAVNTADVVVDEALGYKAADVANQSGIVWSDARMEAPGAAANGLIAVNSWVTFDVTNFVKAATGDTITFTLYAPTAGAYVVDREKAVAGATYEGKAAYLEVVDAYTVAVTGASKITKNGNLVNTTNSVVAYEGAQIKLYETSSETPAFTNGTKVYATDNTTGETGYITVTGADEYYAATVGVAPVDGAQVRIGDGVDENGKVDGRKSGLRFITTVDRDNSLATVAGATFGVRVTAEGSEEYVDIATADDKWQIKDEVYTSALTNLAVGNFNRKFTATPYVIADGQVFYGTPVTRSIYEVAAGLLVNNYADGTEYPEAALKAKSMIEVLNAYVNQTGIRLSVTSAGLTAYTGTGTSAYSGDQFFEVLSSETVSEKVYAITIKPVGANTTINSYWQEYIRINNNNSKIAAFTSLVENEDGSVTITFDYASYLAP